MVKSALASCDRADSGSQQVKSNKRSQTTRSSISCRSLERQDGGTERWNSCRGSLRQEFLHGGYSYLHSRHSRFIVFRSSLSRFPFCHRQTAARPTIDSARWHPYSSSPCPPSALPPRHIMSRKTLRSGFSFWVQLQRHYDCKDKIKINHLNWAIC